MSEIVPADYMPTIKLRVFFDEKEAAKYTQKTYGDVPAMKGDADTLMNGSGIVIIRFKDADKTKERDLIPLMAHESVHAAKEWCDIMSENKPGEEEFAYMVQCVLICVMEECKRHKKKVKKNAKRR